MARSDSDAPNIAVPATMTLLPRKRSKVGKVAQNKGKVLASMRAEIDGVGAYTAVDLDVFLWEAGAKLGDFRNTAFEKFLTSAAWGRSGFMTRQGIYCYRDRQS
jgi:hypothetical protein